MSSPVSQTILQLSRGLTPSAIGGKNTRTDVSMVVVSCKKKYPFTGSG